MKHRFLILIWTVGLVLFVSACGSTAGVSPTTIPTVSPAQGIGFASRVLADGHVDALPTGTLFANILSIAQPANSSIPAHSHVAIFIYEVSGTQTLAIQGQAPVTLQAGSATFLPNNRNVVPAAKQILGLTKKKVHVVETHSVPQGIAAVVAFRPERPGPENVHAMKAEAERVQTIEVTHAVRDTRSNGLKVKKGDVIGLINDKLEFAGADYPEVVKKALGKLGPDSYELVTVYRGQQATDDELALLESEIRSNYPRLEVEVQQGDQQHYPFILSVE